VSLAAPVSDFAPGSRFDSVLASPFERPTAAPSFDDEPPLVALELRSSPPPPSDPDSVPLLELLSLERDGREWPPLRSFLAQPEPLKWIVGGLNALRSVPTAPQAGHALGGPALIEWTISVVLPQFEQM